MCQAYRIAMARMRPLFQNVLVFVQIGAWGKDLMELLYLEDEV